ncbi:MAG TPA: WYL domain-containing protein [Pirellulales bacterium]|jgi:predicted DNA-binding transcriptional regulator YafY|nr:WYL domain-containing protein [Pirellulales bacterium]
MISLLQAGKGHNVDSLAVHCNIGRRTVFRDLDVLRQAGVPLKHDDEFQVYHLADTYFLPPTKFTISEALAVLVLCHELGDVRKMPFLAPAHTAALKLEGSLPAALRKQLHGMADAVRIQLHQLSPVADKVPYYEGLIDAITNRRCVRIDYDDIKARMAIQTRLSPYRLFFSKHAWYVVGRSSLHRSVRTFNMKRFLRMEPTADHYQIPRNFSLERYFGNAWHLIPERGPEYEVCVQFSPMVAPNVGSVRWHKTQRLEWKEDGTLKFFAKVKGLKEICWWILGYGKEAQVLQPPQLQKLIVEHAKRVLTTYDW